MLSFDLQKRLRSPAGDFRLSVELTVAAGEIVALHGPSGAGKTSLLRLLAGLLEPDAGQLSFRGEDWRGVPPRERNVGFVFQDYGLFPTMTVAQNLAFAGGPNARVPDVFELAGLENRYPHQLSGGQRQRVAVARAQVQCPDVLLLDEPLSALDGRLRRRVGDQLREAVSERNIPCLLVSHDPDDILRLADRVALMDDGTITAAGEPVDLLLPPPSNHQLTGTVLTLDGERMLVRVGRQVVWMQRREGANVGDAVDLEVR